MTEGQTQRMRPAFAVAKDSLKDVKSNQIVVNLKVQWTEKPYNESNIFITLYLNK